MSLILKECIEFDEVKRQCTAQEKGKKFILINKTGFKIRKIRVDGCLRQQQNEKRCDYLINAYSPDITKGQKPIAFFIELKGGDLNRAVKQLIDSVVYLKSEFSGHILNARIIGSRNIPQIKNDPHFRKLNRLVKPTSGSIKSGTKVMSESI